LQPVTTNLIFTENLFLKVLDKFSIPESDAAVRSNQNIGECFFV